MSANILSYVWHNSKAKGSARLLLAALADHADHKGEVAISQRELGQLVALSKTSVVEATEKLIQLGELRILGEGKGRGNPLRYWVTGVHKRYHWEAHEAIEPTPPIPPITTEVVEVDPADLKVRNVLYDNLTKPEPLLERILEKQLEDAPLKPPAKPPALPSNVRQIRVESVLAAVGIKPDPAQPFYWKKRAHHDDLDQLLRDVNCDFETLVSRLKAAAPIPQDPPIRRLTRLADFVKVRR